LSSVTLENVGLRFGRNEVLKDINITIRDEELHVLVGPSGCGKSLILRIIAGLIQPTTGRVLIDGQDASRIPPGDRNIAMLFQSFALYPYMSVKENWEFPLQAERLTESEIEQRVREVTEFLEMGILLGRRPGQLSGGQRQRAALGRALVRRPTIFLLDEPISAQDAKKRVAMRTGLKKMQRDLGITMVCVTSDQIEAQALGDRIAVMDVGTLQQVGTPEEIYGQPTNIFVAEFVGSPPINLFDCTPNRQNGNIVLAGPNFEITVPSGVGSVIKSQPEGNAVVLGVRPESVNVGVEQQPASIPAEVYMVEPQSNELLIDLKVGDLTVRARANKDELDFTPQLDQAVHLTFDYDTLHVFDKATGRRIA
jgi:multiple sugar transport system ATP-binding protein